MAKKTSQDKSEAETSSAAATPAPPVTQTQRPIALPPVGPGVDPQLAADIEQDIVDEGGYGRRTTIALQLLRADQPKIVSALKRYADEVHDEDAKAELTKLGAYLDDRFAAIGTLTPQHNASTSGAVHYSDEAWTETTAGAPVAQSVRKVALKRLKDQQALKEQFSPGIVLDASPQGLFDAVSKMITALSLPEKQDLYRQRRIRSALLVTQLTTVQTRLKAALEGGVTRQPPTGEISAALDGALLQFHAAEVRIETEFDQIQRSDLAEAFEGLIPHRRGGRNSDRGAKAGTGQGSGGKAKSGGDSPPNAGEETKPAAGAGEGAGKGGPGPVAPEASGDAAADKPPTDG